MYQITKESISNRVITPQHVMETMMSESTQFSITKDDMGQATWYYVNDLNGNYITSQFYWNEGSYDSNGVHSLYDEYGIELK